MNESLAFLVRHGYTVLLVWVLAEQLGLPLPALPLLLAAGALAGGGQMSMAGALAVVTVAALASDLAWYEIGRRRGFRVLRLLCRMSLEPDSCVRRTEELFARHGARSLIVAKFVPGLNTAAPPLAGIFGMRLHRFVVFDLLGTWLWAGSFLGLGWIFSDEIGRVAEAAERLGAWLVAILVAALALYVLAKWVHRHRFLRRLRIARIGPEELKRRLDAGEPMVVVDLRSSPDFEAQPETIPGALRVGAEQLAEHHERIPRDREIVLFCT
jgi:membrane protein DedA with SNARE-associated domain